jgi:hypothetical protein
MRWLAVKFPTGAEFSSSDAVLVVKFPTGAGFRAHMRWLAPTSMVKFPTGAEFSMPKHLALDLGGEWR